MNEAITAQNVAQSAAKITVQRTLQPLADATARAGLGALADRLLSIRRWVDDDLSALEAVLLGVGGDDVGWAAATHLLHRPGKRVRPLCTVLAARLGHGPPDRALIANIAVAGELVHTATLLHDDVIDLGELRRGAPSSRVVYGNSASVLAGDHLLVEALRAARRGPPVLADELLDAIAQMVGAEALQLDLRGRFDPDPALYWRVVEGKTAALFRWALRAGGHLARLNTTQLEALGAAGDHLGRCFQLVDDALDFSPSAAAIGKLPLADLREGKCTYPVIVAVQRAPALVGALEEIATGAPIEAPLLDAIAATGAVESTHEKASEAAAAARLALAHLPACRARDGLLDLVNATERRTR